MIRTQVRTLLGLLLIVAPVHGAVVLEKTISREHPLLGETGKAMTVGRDGKVYINSGGYLLRMNRDGSQKIGVQFGAGLNRVAVDAQGNFAAPRTPHAAPQIRVPGSNRLTADVSGYTVASSVAKKLCGLPRVFFRNFGCQK